MATQIEIRGHKQFDNINRNKVNRGIINRRITVISIMISTTVQHMISISITRYMFSQLKIVAINTIE